MTLEPAFGVYIHWPFCASKCPYCDFNSHVRHGGIDERAFLAAYRREIAQMAALQPGSRVETIFFGGGTPSLMQPATVEAMLESVAKHWPIAPGAEITLEANPSSVEAERFRSYRAAGVNRVSLGIQALDDRDLRSLGRLHSVAEARAALAIARATFERVSFDLIYARPGQSLPAWRAELVEALAMAPDHLSAYQLTIEDGTPFAALHAAGRLTTPPDQEASELYALTQELTEAAGLPAYEVSNHARPGAECRHNLLYWRYGSYAGIGPGAHGRLFSEGRRLATSNERNPERWRERVLASGHGMIEFQPLTPREIADEMLIMGLRLAEGFDLARLAAATGWAPSPSAISELAAAGLIDLDRTAHRITVTPAGRPVLNRIVLELATASGEAAPPVLGAPE
jgi:oxygen-independent coproporphyrinogen-3 oxidase